MQYFISFLEGIITFISPCLLPMLPIYISYFAGGNAESKGNGRVIRNALGFILGFTAVFVLLGALAGFLGSLFTRYRTLLDIITGTVIVIFGLNHMGVLRLNLFNGARMNRKDSMGFCSAVLFGIVFSVGWTPCVGVFLGSALMLAASGGNTAEGILMLLAYSCGLGIPFFVSAILIEKLKSTFSFIKKHYHIINTVSGLLLVVVGVLMISGLFGKFMNLLA